MTCVHKKNIVMTKASFYSIAIMAASPAALPRRSFLHFDGSSTRITIPSFSGLGPQNPLTFSFWARPSVRSAEWPVFIQAPDCFVFTETAPKLAPTDLAPLECETDPFHLIIKQPLPHHSWSHILLYGVTLGLSFLKLGANNINEHQWLSLPLPNSNNLEENFVHFVNTF